MWTYLLLFVSIALFVWIVIQNNRQGKQIEQLLTSAASGDPEAMRALGDIAALKAMPDLASEWYLKSAEHESGEGYLSRTEALDKQGLYEICEAQLSALVTLDMTPAKFALAKHYLKHQVDTKKAISLLESAALDGDVKAQKALSELLSSDNVKSCVLLTELEKMSAQRKVRHYQDLSLLQSNG